jgi:hypothetical protein
LNYVEQKELTEKLEPVRFSSGLIIKLHPLIIADYDRVSAW